MLLDQSTLKLRSVPKECGGSTGDEFPPLASCSVTDDGSAKHVAKQLYAVLKLGQGTFNVLTKSYSEMDNVVVNNR